MSRNFYKLILLILVFSLLGAACVRQSAPAEFSSQDKTATSSKSLLRRILSPIEGSFGRAQKGASKVISEAGDNLAKNLTDKQKQIVDEWLSKNKLNEFGDAIGTIYVGGTPLFNEATGEAIDRFEYLFAKFPNLRDIITGQTEK